MTSRILVILALIFATLALGVSSTEVVSTSLPYSGTVLTTRANRANFAFCLPIGSTGNNVDFILTIQFLCDGNLFCNVSDLHWPFTSFPTTVNGNLHAFTLRNGSKNFYGTLI
jgi:hypothetical protein